MVFVFHKSICLLIFITFISSSHANTFQVGGKDGWTLHPSESYENWSSRLRFLINDTLHFKYDGGSDSVLVVNKSDYDGCNATNPIAKLEGGDSTFKFDRSGPFYFNSGNKSNCDQGQKLIVVVLALRIRSPPPSIATPPSSSTMPPSVSPVLPPTTTLSPVSPPSGAVSPVYSPTISPVSPPSIAEAPKLSPAGTPTVSPPADSPTGETADSPSGGSTVSPGGGSRDSPGPGGEPAGSPGEGGGGGGSSPGRNSSGAMPPLSGTMITSLVTVMVGFVVQLMI